MTLIITAICTYVQIAAFIGWKVAIGDNSKTHGWIAFAFFIACPLLFLWSGTLSKHA